MKKIYFVRHGESEGIVGSIRGDTTTPLTEHGRNQSKMIAKYFAHIRIDRLICSPLERTKQTAEIISTEIGVPIEYSDLFVERRRPSHFYGKSKNDPEALEFKENYEKNFHLPNFRFADEENFEDLKARAGEALAYLASRSEEHILVVTHGYFMRIVGAHILNGDMLTGEQCAKYVATHHMDPTGMTIATYDESKENTWSLEVWNDNTHLN
ncbi:MAG: histidine phosphatase family protein [bacterium]